MRKTYFKKYFLLSTLLMLSAWAFAQNGSISGKILDEKRQPLTGASITIDGTTLGATADLDGNYRLNGVKPGTYTLTAKFVGYVALKKTVTVNTTSVTAEFLLQPESQSLNEVVVIGYGTQKKSDLTGSVVSVTAKDFNKGPIASADQLVVGKVAGVSITSNGGAPGAGGTIRIRGGSSLNASNDPLIVIDGVPVDNNGVSGSSNPLSLINPDDIASFNVLKDASATAIYGSRASNGVIIITTKKGNSDSKLAVNFSSVNSLSTKTNEVSVLSADQFRAYVNQYGTTASKALLGTSSTNWQDHIYKTAFGTDNNINFSGGIKSLPYRLSVGYLNQDGILKTSNLERTSAALNLSPTFLHNTLSVSLNLKGSVSDTRFANTGAIGAAVAMDPTQPLYSGNNNYGGYYEWLTSTGTLNSNATRNPLGLLEEYNSTAQVKRSIGNIQFDYKIPHVEGLKANYNLGYDVSESNGIVSVPAYAASNFLQTYPGQYYNYGQNKKNIVSDFYLNYARDFKSIQSRIDVTAGYSYQYFDNYTPGYTTYGADRTSVVTAETNAVDYPNKLVSFFGRANYTLMDKYILTGTVRRDWTSRFLNHWGTFPSGAFAWRINQEEFLKDSKVLSELKLRVGYGVTGQQDVPNSISNGSTTVSINSSFPYLAQYVYSDSNAAYQLGNTYTRTLRASGYNTSLKWESTATSNVALDYGFLDGKITGSLEYYHKYTTDLLSLIPFASGTNLTNYFIANVGNLKSDGVEFSINLNPVKTTDFNWTVGFNATWAQSKITKLSNTASDTQIIQTGSISGGTGNTIQALAVGYTPFSYYVYKQLYDANGKAIEGSYADLNGDGVVNSADKYLYKSAMPKYYLGFNSTLEYKKLALNFSMRANLGGYIYNNVASANGAQNNFNNSYNFLSNVSSSITETNFANSQYFSDYYVQKASFLRMDNSNLIYNIGKVYKGKANLRVSGTVQNVFTITPYKGLDPELQGGIDNNFYPKPRTYSIGLNLGF